MAKRKTKRASARKTKAAPKKRKATVRKTTAKKRKAAPAKKKATRKKICKPCKVCGSMRKGKVCGETMGTEG